MIIIKFNLKHKQMMKMIYNNNINNLQNKNINNNYKNNKKLYLKSNNNK